MFEGDDGRIMLAVTGNGTGLPEGLDFRNTKTFGLQLVISLRDNRAARYITRPNGGNCLQ